MSIGCLSPQRPIARLRAKGVCPPGSDGLAELCALAHFSGRPCWLGLLVVALFLLINGCGRVSGPNNGSPAPGISSPPPASPYLSTNYANVDFGNVLIRTASDVTLTLTNTSNVQVVVSERLDSGEAFGLGSTEANLTLAPNQSAPVVVDFEPLDEGPATDTISFQSSASSVSLVITLAGVGVRPKGHFVTLTWNPSMSPVFGYMIYRGTDSGGPYVKLTGSPIQAMSYADVTIQPPQTYFYVVTSVSSQGVQSSFSNEVAVKIPSP